jgi:hypothetical protein
MTSAAAPRRLIIGITGAPVHLLDEILVKSDEALARLTHST